MIFCAHLNMSHHGPPKLFEDAGVDADGLTDIHKVMMKALCIVNWRTKEKGF
jgi:hypothetical protein